MPFLEELFRLVPGCYSIWLWAWGGRVSVFAYFAPGSRVTDRQHLIIGSGAVLGAGCLLGGHMVDHALDGSWQITVAPVDIGSGAVVGARSVLAPGSGVDPGEVMPATERLPPHCRWSGGRRHRRGGV